MIMIKAAYAYTASDEQFLSVIEQANKGDINAQFELANLYLDKSSAYHHQAQGLKYHAKLASNRYYPSVTILAHFYSYAHGGIYKPRKAEFWYKVLEQDNQPYDKYLRGFVRLSLESTEEREVQSLLKTNPQASEVDSYKLLQAKTYEKLKGGESHSISLYEQLLVNGVDVSYFLEALYIQKYGPSLMGKSFLNNKFHEVKNALLTHDIGSFVETLHEKKQYFNLDAADSSVLQAIGFIINDSDEIKTVYQYFKELPSMNFKAILSQYEELLGQPSYRDEQKFQWNFLSLTIELAKGKNGKHHLISTLREKND